MAGLFFTFYITKHTQIKGEVFLEWKILLSLDVENRLILIA